MINGAVIIGVSSTILNSNYSQPPPIAILPRAGCSSVAACGFSKCWALPSMPSARKQNLAHKAAGLLKTPRRNAILTCKGNAEHHLFFYHRDSHSPGESLLLIRCKLLNRGTKHDSARLKKDLYPFLEGQPEEAPSER